MASKDRRAWEAFLAGKQAKGKLQSAGSVRRAKGIGPNKACGHKGGIRRQGSKR